jgi:hypothetical protein
MASSAGQGRADAPRRAVEAEHAPAQPRGPGLGHQHRADRPLAVQRKTDETVKGDECSPGRRQRHQRNHQRKHRDIDRQNIAAAEPVGQPGPQIETGDADQHRDLHPAAVGAEIERELLHQQRRDQGEDRAVHAVEAPTEPVGPGDVPVGRGQPRGVGGVAVVPIAQVPRFERPGCGDGAGLPENDRVLRRHVFLP